MWRVLLAIAFVGLSVSVIPSFSDTTPGVTESSSTSTSVTPCGCGATTGSQPSSDESSEVALQNTTVCLFYVWANHGSWCSWYGMTCNSGPPRNVDSANCGVSGNCGTPVSPGCITSPSASKLESEAPPGAVSIDDGGQESGPGAAPGRTEPVFLMKLAALDSLHPGKQGYKGDRFTKKAKLDKPKDKNLTVVENSKQHVRLEYKIAGGTHTIDAQIFSCDVSHTKYPGFAGTMFVGFEIEKPSTGTPLLLTAVDETDSHCVTVDYNGVPVEIILHEESPAAAP